MSSIVSKILIPTIQTLASKATGASILSFPFVARTGPTQLDFSEFEEMEDVLGALVTKYVPVSLSYISYVSNLALPGSTFKLPPRDPKVWETVFSSRESREPDSPPASLLASDIIHIKTSFNMEQPIPYVNQDKKTYSQNERKRASEAHKVVDLSDLENQVHIPLYYMRPSTYLCCLSAPPLLL